MKTVYVDMDGVLVDFQSGIEKIPGSVMGKYLGRLDEVPGIFDLMEPMLGAVESFGWLAENFDTYILTTAPWDNPGALTSKRLWVERYLMPHGYKRLITSHYKNLCRGDFLIDDRTANGAGDFGGELIQFGSESFPDWNTVTTYLQSKK